MRFRSKDRDVRFEADVAHDEVAAITPWGRMSVRSGDVLVPHGNKVVPIPLALLQRWFDDSPTEADMERAKVQTL